MSDQSSQPPLPPPASPRLPVLSYGPPPRRRSNWLARRWRYWREEAGPLLRALPIAVVVTLYVLWRLLSWSRLFHG
jgi:hypothetical protein